MSITIISALPSLLPVGNSDVVVVSSNNTASANFRYVCDVSGSLSSARLKCDKLPTTNNGFFGVSKVVETLIAPNENTLHQRRLEAHNPYPLLVVRNRSGLTAALWNVEDLTRVQQIRLHAVEGLDFIYTGIEAFGYEPERVAPLHLVTHPRSRRQR